MENNHCGEDRNWRNSAGIGGLSQWIATEINEISRLYTTKTTSSIGKDEANLSTSDSNNNSPPFESQSLNKEKYDNNNDNNYHENSLIKSNQFSYLNIHRIIAPRFITNEYLCRNHYICRENGGIVKVCIYLIKGYLFSL